jgi:hypothetical protein
MCKKTWNNPSPFYVQEVFCRISSNSQKKQKDFSRKGGKMVGDISYAY